MQKRYEQLDSIRGLAAITVVLNHCFSIVNPTIIYTWLSYTPFIIVVAGHQAVILFFVLSGFVLSLPFMTKEIHYPSFMIRRICRIYIPYLAAITAAAIMWELFTKNGIRGLSDWFNLIWTGGLDFKLIINHILMTGSKQYKLDPVIWSLVQEMRIYFIFPFILLFVVKRGLKASILLGVLFSFTGLMSKYYFGSSSVVVTLSETLHYVSLFILGALLAKHMNYLVSLLTKTRKSIKFTALISGWLLYTYNNWFMHDNTLVHNWVTDDWISALGASIIFILALSSVTVTKFLLIKPIHFVGKISYSLYLFHMVVLLTIFNLFYGVLPLSMIYVISFILIAAVSTLSYYFIESPSNELGKKLSQRIPYMFHLVFRNLHYRKGGYQNEKFEYHHHKMKQYRG